MKNSEAFIGGESGGIPERVFTPGFNDVEEGKSGGTELQCFTDRTLIDIFDKSDPVFGFKAELLSDAITINVRSRDFDGERHPDIYAAKLIKRAIGYFEEQDRVVTKFYAEWGSVVSESYDTYRDFLAAVSTVREVTKEDQETAARQTWTGQLASSLGFTEISEIVDYDENVYVVFEKPQTTPE